MPDNSLLMQEKELAAALSKIRSTIKKQQYQERKRQERKNEIIRARLSGRPRKPSESLTLAERQAIQEKHFGHKRVYGTDTETD